MNNPFQMLQAIKNPQQFLNNAMNNSTLMQNPLAKNAIEMYQKGDTKGLNELAQNLCKERGIEPEEAFKQVKSYFGM